MKLVLFYLFIDGNLMKRALLLIFIILSLSLNAADDNTDYDSRQIHPLELTACGAAEQMHLFEMAARRRLLAEERSNTCNPSKKNECNCQSAFAAQIEEKTRKAIEAKLKQNDIK